jgi:hypothetical protein
MARILIVNYYHFATDPRISGAHQTKECSMKKPDLNNDEHDLESNASLGYMNTFVGVLLVVVVLIVALPQIASASSCELPRDPDMVEKDLENIGLYPTSFEAGLRAYNDGNHGKALTIWRPIAESGHALAQYNIGIAYARGTGVEKDLVAASRWWKRSALQGHRDSAYNLGLIYARGDNQIPRDMVLAAHWWQQAAIHGDAVAQFNLGMMYARGDGVKQDMETAIRWWQLSANQGFAGAREILDQLARDSAKLETK